MTRYGRILLAAVGILAAAGVAGTLYRSPAQDRAGPSEEKKLPEISPAAAVRKSAEAFVATFNKGDARALAAFWTKDAEFVGPDGEVIRGRAAIEKDHAEFFKKH